MKTRFIFTMIILTTFALSQVVFAEENSYESPFNNLMFADVNKEHENFEAMYFLYNIGVIEGYEKSGSKLRDYKPDLSINRAEFLKLLLEGTDKASNEFYSKCFPDVPEKEWYSTYVCQAKQEGWINGYPDGTFKPTQTINEVETLKILGEVLGWTVPEYDSVEPWYKGYLEAATERNLLEESKPEAMMNRGGVAEMIFRNTQIEELSLESFNEEHIDNLFYTFEIPFDGAFGPGGVFGPGGAFGPAGAFHEDGRFEMEDKFELLGDDFFENRYCYYSDEGGYLDIVDEILFEVTDGKIDSIEKGGFDIDGFGVMFCYDAHATTTLQLFTKELRDQYGVKCWMDPSFSTSEDFGLEKILCYVKPAEPEFEAEEIEEVELEPSINAWGENVWGDVNVGVYGLKETVVANEQVNLEIFLTDNKDNPISGQKLSIKAYTGIDSIRTIEVEEVGNGVYRSSFVSTLSGDYSLDLETPTGKVGTNLAVEVTPGKFDHAKIIDVIEPYESGDAGMAMVKFVGRDAYGNVLEYSDDNNLGVVASEGLVSVKFEDGIFTAEINAEDYGIVDLNIVDRNTETDLGVSTSINFFPVQIDAPKGINKEAVQVEAPVSVYFPEKYGKLGSYDFTLKYSPETLTFLNLVDFDEDDDIKLPLFEVNQAAGQIRIWQPQTDVNKEGYDNVPLAMLLFDVKALGSGTLYVDAATVKDQLGKVVDYLSGFADTIGGSLDSWIDEAWKWALNVKDRKDVCIDAFIAPAAGVTEANVGTDVATANLIFTKVADNCNCKFYINFVLKSVTTLTAGQWGAVDIDGDSVVDVDDKPGEAPFDEGDALNSNHPASAGCIPVYYVPGLGGTTMGMTTESPTTRSVMVNNAMDDDNRTLAHELVHRLGKNMTVDQGHADAADQGADTPGNLMNYDNTGDDLSKKQCEEMEKNLP